MGARAVDIAEVGAGAIQRLIAPGVHAPIRAAGGLFPFRFGGQPSASPGAVIPRLEPVHPDDGIIVKFRVAVVFIVGIRAGYPGQLAGARGHAQGILAVGDLVFVDPISIQVHGMLGDFQDKRARLRWFAWPLYP